MSLYLKDNLKFSGSQIGLIIGLSAVSSIVSPVIMTFVADRLISSERLLSLLHLLGAGCMLAFSYQSSFYPVMIFYFIYTLLTLPSSSLINAITFHHSPADRQKFGNIRVWGTVGWIAVAWFFSFGILHGKVPAEAPSRLPLLLKISALTSLLLSIYALSMPVKQKAGKGEVVRSLFPVDSFKIMLNPQVIMLSIIVMFITFIDKFYSVGTAPFLRQMGFSEKSILPAMSLGQIPEIFAMGLLGFLISRWGMKKVLVMGMVLEIFRFATCAFGKSDMLIYSSLSVHGLAYTFVFITSFICLDGYCDNKERTGVHQLFSVLTAGVGGFLGSFSAGRIADIFSENGVVDYKHYWSIPLVFSIVILGALMVFIRESSVGARVTPEPAAARGVGTD